MDGEDRYEAGHDRGIPDDQFDQFSTCQIWLDDVRGDRRPARAGEQEVQARSHVDKAPDPRTDDAMTGAAGVVWIGQDELHMLLKNIAGDGTRLSRQRM